MPRITKKLPLKREAYTFGDLVYWHLFRFGTRPTSNPADKAGRVWEIDAVCTLLGITQRTLRNWIADKHLPDSVGPLSRELFGDSPEWDEARLELQEKFEQGWAKRRMSKGVGAATAKPDVAPDRPRLEASGPGQNAVSAEPATGVLVRVGEVPYPHHQSSSSASRSWGAALVALLFAGAAVMAWVEIAPRLKVTRAPPPEVVATKPTAKVVPPPVVEDKAPEVVPAPLPLPEVKEAAKPPPPPVPTEEEKQLAAERALVEKLVETRQAAHDTEVRRREDEARRLDGERRETADRQAWLEADARTVAAIGYRLRENTSVAAASIGHVLTATAADCALACLREGCDAFAWYRDQYGRSSTRRRVCYFFRGPFETSNNPGYVLGVPNVDASVPEKPSAIAVSNRAPIRLAQAGPAASNAPDDLVRCAGGPIKVTGFKLTCDRILGGGTTLGSARLSYTVANINECANKCRAVSRCVAFTFNSGDPAGSHACMIFGPTPEGRVSAGWVSGVR